MTFYGLLPGACFSCFYDVMYVVFYTLDFLGSCFDVHHVLYVFLLSCMLLRFHQKH